MTKVNSFDVLKEMSARNMSIQLAPLDNITEARKVKAGTKVTIGIGGDVVGSILNNKFVGGLILADRKEFEAVRKELEARDATRSTASAGTEVTAG